ncbi:MAG: hypothetical protein ABFD92_18155 [Planctomycetaceae bacterium]|nr:hypothetical protein [Planctomycetaceae bacterium]
MKASPGNVVAVLSVMALLAAGAPGQTVPLQSGRLLDKNIQVGSGGINAPTGGQGGVNNQLYVSGALQGYTSQIANGQLLDRNTQLGSTGYNTVAGGVGGVNTELLANRAQSGTLAFRGEVPYQALRGIQTSGAGLAGPTGLSGLLRSSEPYAAQLNEVFSQYSSLVSPQTGSAPVPGAASAPELAKLFTSGASGDLAAMSQRLFGPAPVVEGQPLDNQLGQMRLSGRVDSQVYSRVDSQIDHRLDAQAPAVPLPQQPAAPTGDTGEQSLMIDILKLLATQRETEGDSAQRVPPAPAAPAPAAAAGAARRTTLGPIAMIDGEVVVRDLGGRGKTLFDKYMLQGRELLKQGKYYTAAGAYENAAILQSADPMPYVGWGLALLGAGEHLSAAERLRMAVAVFPPLMKTRIDVASMMDSKLLDRRLTEISQRVVASKQNEGMLAFAAAFLEYNLRRDTDARYFAGRLRADAGDDPVFRGYASFVLGEKTAPATAPAEQP